MKRRTNILFGAAVWMLFMMVVDVYWNVMPIIPADAIYNAESVTRLRQDAAAGIVNVGFHPSLLDLACLVGFGGVYLAMTVRRLGAANLLPTRDPRLKEALAFENV